MGLTNSSVGAGALSKKLVIEKTGENERIIALAGNPNVGKSTIFNALCGMKQHTGNWPGKTVTNARGIFKGEKNSYILVDLPGTYSLSAHSAEEETARDFICFGGADAVVVVCDATCLERNLNLVLQILEITEKVIVCVNLMDEAKRKHIEVDLTKLSEELKVPCVGTNAEDKKTLDVLCAELDAMDQSGNKKALNVTYSVEMENAISKIIPHISEKCSGHIGNRFVAMKLLSGDADFEHKIGEYLNCNFDDDELLSARKEADEILISSGINKDKLEDMTVKSIVGKAEEIAGKTVSFKKSGYAIRDIKIDKLLTGRGFAYPIMFLLLTFILWLTVTGANYPSALLGNVLFKFQDVLSSLFVRLNAPEWLHGALVLGVYRVLAWVVSVMLPPMTIFFPLFTFLEDAGYLPRIAYNLDKPFKKCNACGKQALTMCMGFGCNAAGVTGCRIIDSERERILAILTNSLVPCNGRFPTLISVITMFCIGTASGIFGSVKGALLLSFFIILGILATFGVTYVLSKTILRGTPSSFTLELPPYRKPQLKNIIVRSILDRTIFVLGRAAAIAAPAGLIIWICANVHIGGESILNCLAGFFDPFAKLMGLDGVILMAFILGFPANEIVIPIIIMAYTAQGCISELATLEEMKELFISNGWNALTAVNMMLFSLFHFPCSTTLLTVKKETGKFKWTLLAALIPTFIGIILCMFTKMIYRIFS